MLLFISASRLISLHVAIICQLIHRAVTPTCRSFALKYLLLIDISSESAASLRRRRQHHHQQQRQQQVALDLAQKTKDIQIDMHRNEGK